MTKVLNIYKNPILILDFGSQYAQLIARRVRELGVYCVIKPYDVKEDFFDEFKPAGIILSGGPETVLEDITPRAPEAIFKLGIPILGICYGMQTLVYQLGGVVAASSKREFGHAELEITCPSLLFEGLDSVTRDVHANP